MKRSIFAVCDLEVEYAYSFMDYANRKRNLPFEIQAFTGSESLIRFAKEKRIEILLISEKTMRASIKELNIGQIMILSEGGCIPELKEYPSVYKYQSSENVIREVLTCYGADRETQEAVQVAKRGMQIVGVYSPVGRCGKTSFAWTMAQTLAKNRAVLYLNLEEYAGFELLFGHKKYEHTLSDILYFVRQKNKNLAHKISGMIETVGKLDYLPPAWSLEDLRIVTETEWHWLLDTLTFQSAYEIVVIDFGNGIDGLFSLLQRCDRLYVPELPERISQCKIAQMEALLEKEGWTEVLGKMQKLRLPTSQKWCEGQAEIEQLLFSELGDYVRTLLRKEGVCEESFFAH